MFLLVLLQSAERLQWDEPSSKFCTLTLHIPLCSWFFKIKLTTCCKSPQVLGTNTEIHWLKSISLWYWWNGNILMYLTKNFNTPSSVIPLYRIQQEFRLFTAAETAQNHQQSSYWINEGSWQIILATCQTTTSNPNIAELNLPLLAFLSSPPSSRDKPWGYMAFKLRETVLAALFHSC